ncbi:MAG: insulinase family protein [Alistipes sp.]|nr:insulinase family protein [Alistipes sp.]
MKRFLTIVAIVVALCATACSEYHYEKVAGDPLKTRIYTLDNGLKVYMTVNKETPRIQTYIAVKVGAKNDPAETTGLAHYFEHLMFKGTERFGTSDYAAEAPLLEQIEQLFEIYRNTEDPTERKRLYALIDSVSQEASKYAIPNEYDKLMSAIGASGTNAWTSFDETVYTEDIPSNQIENWAKIQSDRFANNVIRGFHTELETVYEEYNMSLTRDGNKAYYGILELLHPNHPCGQHSVLGTQEHLKNPSITNIKNYYKTYYVPNNMAICMSGDFDPEKAIAIIDKHFGSLKPNPELPEFSFPEAEPITSPKVKEVYGNDAEFLYLGWRTGSGMSCEDSHIQEIVGEILHNGKCGLLDTDLLQQQKVLRAFASSMIDADLSSLIFGGYPKQGQSLDEVRDLLLSQVAKLRNGEFDEELISSTIANYKRYLMEELEYNGPRAMQYVSTFINGIDWADQVKRMDKMSQITKADVVAWANKYLGEDNYAIIYKRQGEDKNQKKIDKPIITPIATNRDAKSDFLAEIQLSEVNPIEPVFVDFERDMSVSKMKGHDIEVLYKRNTTNDLFTLMYAYEFGNADNPRMKTAIQYFKLLGTASKSLEQIQSEFYSMACDFHLSISQNRAYVSISGLKENMTKAMALAEEYMSEVEGNDEVLSELKRDILKSRHDSKLNQKANNSALRNYAMYGPEAIKAMTLTNEQLEALTSEELLGEIKALNSTKHRVLYYGPLSQRELIAELDKSHSVAETLTDPEQGKVIHYIQPTPKNRILLAHYDAKQIYYEQYSKRESDIFSTDNDAAMLLYNTYFGGGMNAIVFQEMREARGLAYSARAIFAEQFHKEDGYTYTAFIATQNDKMQQAMEAFAEIINDMPQSENAFEIAKQSVLTSLATERVIKESVLWHYLAAKNKGVDYDRNAEIYNKIQSMTLEDVVAFQQEWIKDRTYTYCILGDKHDLDMKYLRSIGEVTLLSQEEIFGY